MFTLVLNDKKKSCSFIFERIAFMLVIDHLVSLTTGRHLHSMVHLDVTVLVSSCHNMGVTVKTILWFLKSLVKVQHTSDPF